jgi:hypothetical protein
MAYAMLLDPPCVALFIDQGNAGDVTLNTVNTVLDAKLKAIRCEVMTDVGNSKKRARVWISRARVPADESSEDDLVTFLGCLHSLRASQLPGPGHRRRQTRGVVGLYKFATS